MRMVAGTVTVAVVAVMMVQPTACRTRGSHGSRTRWIVPEEGSLLRSGPGSTPGAPGRVRRLQVAPTVVVVAAGVVVLLLMARSDAQAGGYAVGGAIGAVVVAVQGRE